MVSILPVSAGTHNTVKNDVASSVVGGVGIGLFPDATGDTVKGNTANNNSSYGFYAEYWAKGSSNHATGNGTNCYRVHC